MRRYHHEDGRWPQAVTGKAGVRYGSYTYDAQGRITRSELSGGTERLDFAYGSNASGQSTTTVTDYTGAQRPGAQRQCANARVKSCLLPNQTDRPRRQRHLHYDARDRETERAVFPASYNTAATRPALANATRVVYNRQYAAEV